MDCQSCHKPVNKDGAKLCIACLRKRKERAENERQAYVNRRRTMMRKEFAE